MGGANDNLRFAGVLDDDGCGPAGRFIAWLPPKFPSGDNVERNNKRISLVIPVDDYSISMQCGRGPFAVAMLDLHFSEVLFPDNLAGSCIKAKEAIGTKGCNDMVTGGDG